MMHIADSTGIDPRDPSNLRGKLPPATEDADLVVVGAGPAGLAAAIEGAGAGLRVMLVEEHPVDPALMGMDVPLRFGGRMDGSVARQDAVIAAMVDSRPDLERAYEVGVDVRLGTTAWGIFPASVAQSMPGAMLGLSDGHSAWMVGYRHLVVATGARDLGIAFGGWDAPGVVGLRAAQELIGTYHAFTARRMVVLGAGERALDLCRLALASGIEIPAVVETAALPRDPDLRSAVEGLGLAFRLADRVEALTDPVAGVCGIRLHRDADGRAEEIACDTICSAIGAVPAIELLAACGCATVHDGRLGGHVPVIGARGQTSIPGILAAGDCAGLTRTEEEAVLQGRLVARVAAGAGDGDSGDDIHNAVFRASPAGDATGYRMAWLAPVWKAMDDALSVCLCESVSAPALAHAVPPSYLAGSFRGDLDAVGLGPVLAEEPPDQDQLKRITRAGMGVCQGRRCREQVALLLALRAGVPVSEVPLASYRPPVRPLPLGLLAPREEAAVVRDSWVSWFSIPTQSIPAADDADGLAVQEVRDGQD